MTAETNPAASAVNFTSTDPAGSTIDADSAEIVYRTGVSYNHNINVSRGIGGTSYYFSAGYADQEGIVQKNDFKRISALLNVDFRISKIFSLGGKLSFSNERNLAAANSGSLAGGAFRKTPSPYTDWVPVIRYAEVLLNLAEAKVRARNAVEAQAIALLNAVHGRSDAAKVFTAADFPTAADFLTAVDNERRMEFMGEGHRTRDITRLLKPFPAHGGAPAKALNDVGYIWPIPAAELSLNPAMSDN